MCGLIAGAPGSDQADVFYPCRNVAESATLYTVDPADHYRAEIDADDRDWEINGVVHSHTHSEPYPSPTLRSCAAFASSAARSRRNRSSSLQEVVLDQPLVAHEAPDRRQVERDHAVCQRDRERRVLRDARLGQTPGEAGLHDTDPARYRDEAAEQRHDAVDEQELAER